MTSPSGPSVDGPTGVSGVVVVVSHHRASVFAGEGLASGRHYRNDIQEQKFAVILLCSPLSLLDHGGTVSDMGEIYRQQNRSEYSVLHYIV